MKENLASLQWGLATYAIVRNPKGHVLMLRRSQITEHFSGCWELPGGKPAPGETFNETGLIKVFEETGLDVKLTGVAGAVEGVIPELRFVMLILEARTRATTIELNEEHDTYAWMPLADALSLKLHPSLAKFLPGYLKQQKAGAKKRTGRRKR